MTKGRITAKFGGSSVQSDDSIRNVRDIIRADRRRKFIVVSAPKGVTNTLVEWCDASNRRRRQIWTELKQRFRAISAGLGTNLDIDALFERIEREVRAIRGREWRRHFVVSRGEWLNAQIIAAHLGFRFLDAAMLFCFTQNGKFDYKATLRRAKSLKLATMHADGVVIPGFYGGVKGRAGYVCTFSRGGSDITGAIVACLTEAKVYENWTDVNGVYAADPRIVPDARKNETMTYRELRELSFMGAKVFHEAAVAFVRSAGIPVHVRNTFQPEDTGTYVAPKLSLARRCNVTGVAGKNGFSIVTLEKFGMDEETGILARAADMFARAGIGVNVTSSIDSMTFIVETRSLRPHEDRLVRSLRRTFELDDIRVEHDIALVCTVGEGMRHTPGMSALVDTALAQEQINIILELQGGSEINIIRGIKVKDYERGIRAIYRNVCT